MVQNPPPYRPIPPDSVDDQWLEFEIPREDTIRLSKTEIYLRDLKTFEEFDWAQYRKDSVQYEKELANPEYDSSKIILIQDSLFDFRKSHPVFEWDKNYWFTSEGFAWNVDPDTTWLPLFKELVENRSEPEFLNISNIKAPFPFRSAREFVRSDSNRIAAVIKFSKPVYNAQANKAALYYEFICGSLCGSGSILFLEHINGKWEIATSSMLWIS